MRYKKIIVNGCSFTVNGNWSSVFEDYLKTKNFKFEFSNLALSAQGNDLIQKKTLLEVSKSLENYDPIELVIFVMWSGTERKAYYVDNPVILNNQNYLNIFSDEYHSFRTLENKKDKNKGWALTMANGLNINLINNHLLAISDEYYVHNTLENILMVQNYCKTNKVELYQMFYMDYVYQLIESTKNNELVNYLYKEIDFTNFIMKDKSIHGYLTEKNNNSIYFKSPGDEHPSSLGSQIWFNEILLPYLESNKFFG